MDGFNTKEKTLLGVSVLSLLALIYFIIKWVKND